MSKNKAQGTRWESEIVEILNIRALSAKRLPEGGAYDLGDIGFQVANIDIVIEARDRETMQVHTATAKAKAKSGGAITAVIWKRKKRKAGNQVRTQVGPPVVVMPLNDWLVLIERLKEKE